MDDLQTHVLFWGRQTQQPVPYLVGSYRWDGLSFLIYRVANILGAKAIQSLGHLHGAPIRGASVVSVYYLL